MIGVRAAVVVDIDVLRSPQIIQHLLAQRGIDPSQVVTRIKRLTTQIEQINPGVSIRTLRDRISAAISAEPDENKVAPRHLTREIGKILRDVSPWSRVKAAGRREIPSGDATRDFDYIFSELRKADIHIIPVGELEGFCKSVGGHGPGWLREVLTKDVASDEELSEARDFVRGAILRQC